MRFVFLFFILMIFTDLYFFRAVKKSFSHSSVSVIYMTISILIYVLFGFLTYYLVRYQEHSFRLRLHLFIGLFALLYLPKLLVCGFLFIEDIIRLFVGTYRFFASSDSALFLPGRRKFISQAALATATIPFLGILHGIFYGRYRYRVIRKVLIFPDLPSNFDGYTITHISDIHCGSFSNKEKVQHSIDLVNKQNSDTLLFTGDLVNYKADELDAWLPYFKNFKAKDGLYSTLGNHDYGDYYQWNSTEEKKANMAKLFESQKEIGFDLLNNEKRTITRGDQHINIIGVENWGVEPFPQWGDLKKATETIQNGEFNILMSHDPSHFDEKIKQFEKKIHLTLSGHTHGMQFGIEIPGWVKWSPIQYRYKKWAGLYEENNRLLYVNRGFGFIGFPGRVGIWPEITVFELRKGPKRVAYTPSSMKIGELSHRIFSFILDGV